MVALTHPNPYLEKEGRNARDDLVFVNYLIASLLFNSGGVSYL